MNGNMKLRKAGIFLTTPPGRIEKYSLQDYPDWIISSMFKKIKRK